MYDFKLLDLTFPVVNNLVLEFLPLLHLINLIKPYHTTLYLKMDKIE